MVGDEMVLLGLLGGVGDKLGRLFCVVVVAAQGLSSADEACSPIVAVGAGNPAEG